MCDVDTIASYQEGYNDCICCTKSRHLTLVSFAKMLLRPQCLSRRICCSSCNFRLMLYSCAHIRFLRSALCAIAIQVLYACRQLYVCLDLLFAALWHEAVTTLVRSRGNKDSMPCSCQAKKQLMCPLSHDDWPHGGERWFATAQFGTRQST